MINLSMWLIAAGVQGSCNMISAANDMYQMTDQSTITERSYHLSCLILSHLIWPHFIWIEWQSVRCESETTKKTVAVTRQSSANYRYVILIGRSHGELGHFMAHSLDEMRLVEMRSDEIRWNEMSDMNPELIDIFINTSSTLLMLVLHYQYSVMPSSHRRCRRWQQWKWSMRVRMTWIVNYDIVPYESTGTYICCRCCTYDVNFIVCLRTKVLYIGLSSWQLTVLSRQRIWTLIIGGELCTNSVMPKIMVVLCGYGVIHHRNCDTLCLKNVTCLTHYNCGIGYKNGFW